MNIKGTGWLRWIALGALVTISTCSRYPERITLRFEIQYPGLASGSDIQLLANGRPAAGASFESRPNERLPDGFEKYIRLDVPARVGRKGLVDPPSLSMKLLLTSGWIEEALSYYPPDLEDIRDGLKYPPPGIRVIRIDSPHFSTVRTISLWVDNRGGKGGELSIGEVERPIAADSASCVKVYSLEGSPTAVRFEGKPIGGLSLPGPKRDEHVKPQDNVVTTMAELEKRDFRERPTFLVDISGARCYRVRHVFYGFGGGEESPVYLSGQKIYPLSMGDPYYFLERAPDQIKVTTSESGGHWSNNAVVMELIEIPCSSIPAGLRK